MKLTYLLFAAPVVLALSCKLTLLSPPTLLGPHITRPNLVRSAEDVG